MLWIIADPHGCYHTLSALVARVLQADPEAKFGFTGDYVDRGPHSKEVIDLILKLKADGRLEFALRGNHDDVVGHILGNPSQTDLGELCLKPHDMNHVLLWWTQNGFIPTFQSYAPKVPVNQYLDWLYKDYRKILDVLKQEVPESHIEFFRTLPCVWSNDSHFAAHAYASPTEELRDFALTTGQKTEMLWSRFPRTYATGVLCVPTCVWNKIGVFGHTPVKYYGATTPIKHEQIRLIDTMAFDGEYLCAFCCEADDWILEATAETDLG